MLFSFSWKGDDGTWQKCPMHEDPLHLVPLDLRPALLARLNEGRKPRRLPGHHPGRPVPLLPADVQRAPGQVRRRLEPHARRGQGLPPDPVRAGPHRHRHLPAQGREEPGLDRADRRHQLPQDRRVRHRQRSARLQLRRRAEHRQPRPGRVHRSAQARRGVPLRPARRLAGAQDQAEEVRPDRHRRGDPRATPTSRNIAACRTTSSWKRSATAR